MIRKYHLKFLIFGLFLFCTVSYILYTCVYATKPLVKSDNNVQCELYGEPSNCVEFDEKVFLPASKVASIYDVYGFYDEDSKTYFLSPNDIKYKRPNEYIYSSTGKYLFFEKYNVELRSKVKTISVDEGIPISIQWDKNGYKYPIQIAQFGLSHYSKWSQLKEHIESSDSFNLLDLTTRLSPWLSDISSYKSVKFNKIGLTFFSTKTISKDVLQSLSSFVIHGNQVEMNILRRIISKFVPVDDVTLPEFHVIGTDWEVGSALHIKVLNEKLGEFHVIYACKSLENIEPPANVFVYRIKKCDKINLIRNLYVDIIKKMPPKMVENNATLLTLLKTSVIDDIVLYGEGSIVTFQLSNQFSYDKFLQAANWFVENQGRDGGWPNNVVRRIYYNVKLQPGWNSAMAQGHAISLLTRAYHTTKDKKYLMAASKALHLFDVDVNNNGISTTFMGQKSLVWYEEYPTKPSMFVLNGFIYSLFGLQDYVRSEGPLMNKAMSLLKAGIESLEILLPLFDSGSGSFYDLRHISFPMSNVKLNKKSLRPWEVHDGPNRARWEYHVVHLEQLFFLGNTLSPKNVIFLDAAERFLYYLKGYRSSHN